MHICRCSLSSDKTKLCLAALRRHRNSLRKKTDLHKFQKIQINGVHVEIYEIQSGSGSAGWGETARESAKEDILCHPPFFNPAVGRLLKVRWISFLGFWNGDTKAVDFRSCKVNVFCKIRYKTDFHFGLCVFFDSFSDAPSQDWNTV